MHELTPWLNAIELRAIAFTHFHLHACLGSVHVFLVSPRISSQVQKTHARTHAHTYASKRTHRYVSSLIAKHTGRHVGKMGSGLLLAHPLLMSG